MLQDQIVDPREVVAQTRADYWYSYGTSPIKSGVCVHRFRMSDVAFGDVREFTHCGQTFRMECVEMTSDVLTFREVGECRPGELRR